MRSTLFAARHIALFPLVALALSACVGSTPEEEFNREVRDRGGGLSEPFVFAALDAVEAERGVNDLDLVQVTGLPDEVLLGVAVSGGRGGVEWFRFTRHEGLEALAGEPERRHPLIPQRAEAPPFHADDVPVDQLDERINDALRVAEIYGGDAGSVEVKAIEPAEGPVTLVNVHSRAEVESALVAYANDGARTVERYDMLELLE